MQYQLSNKELLKFITETTDNYPVKFLQLFFIHKIIVREKILRLHK